MHTIRDENVEHFKELLLFPDYSCSGIWCICGLGLSNPEKLGTVPKNLIDIADLWNQMWELTHVNSTTDYYAYNPFFEEIVMIGKYLEKEISKYVPCTFDEKMYYE